MHETPYITTIHTWMILVNKGRTEIFLRVINLLVQKFIFSWFLVLCVKEI